MKNPFAKLLPSALLLAIVGLVAGCTFTIGTDPNAYPVPSAEVPALPSGVKVEVVNGFTAPNLYGMANRQQADLQEFSETAVVVFGRELTSKGLVVGPGATKKIVLKVLAPTWNQGFGFIRGVVSLEAQLGATTVTTAGEAAGMDVSRDFSAAITNAVTSLLKRPELLAYLSKP